jgi:hypothetical protein
LIRLLRSKSKAVLHTAVQKLRHGESVSARFWTAVAQRSADTALASAARTTPLVLELVQCGRPVLLLRRNGFRLLGFVRVKILKIVLNTVVHWAKNSGVVHLASDSVGNIPPCRFAGLNAFRSPAWGAGE